jgi:hypothetical protein
LGYCNIFLIKIGIGYYLYNAVKFQMNKEEAFKGYPFIEGGIGFTIVVWFCHIIQLLVFLGVINLLVTQIQLIYNDKTFWETKKAPDLEGYFCCLPSRGNREDHRVNSFIII